MPDVIALLGMIAKIDAPWAQWLTALFTCIALLVSLRGYIKKQDEPAPSAAPDPVILELTQEVLDEVRRVRAGVEDLKRMWR